MKNTGPCFYSLLLMIICFSACTKTDTNPPPPPSPPSIPSTPSTPSTPSSGPQGSYTIYTPGNHVKQIQYFEYSASNQLAVVRSITYDTSAASYGPAGVTDSFSISFNLSGTATLPSSYDIVFHFYYSPAGGTTEHHLLEYDAQNRVIRDSISDGNNMTNQSCVHFRYGAGDNPYCENVIWNPYLSDTGQVISADTLNIDSENISYRLNYRNPNGDSKEYDNISSQYSNPLYNELWSKSIGLTLVVHNFSDFRSKNLPYQALRFFLNETPIDLAYTWTTDSAGRVISGYGRAGSNAGPVAEIISYTYRN